MSTTPQNQAAIVAIEKLPALQLFDPAVVDPLLDKIEAEALAYDPDISTESGRKELASRAYKLAKMKTWFDEQRKNLVSSEKRKLAKIDAEGTRIWTRLETLQKKVREPLTEWEQKEKDRIAGHEAKVAMLADYYEHGPTPTVDCLKHSIAELEAISTADMEEFQRRGDLAKSESLHSLRSQLTAAEKREADAAELEKHRREAAERAQKEHEENIARLAREEAEQAAERKQQAESARIEREARQREEMERAAKEKAIKDKLDAEARAAKAEADRLKAIEDARIAAARASDQAEADRHQAAAVAKANQEAAIQREREYVAAERDAARRAQELRDADTAHRRKVNTAVLKALMALGVPHDTAVLVIQSIVKGEIPHVRLTY